MNIMLCTTTHLLFGRICLREVQSKIFDLPAHLPRSFIGMSHVHARSPSAAASTHRQQAAAART